MVLARILVAAVLGFGLLAAPSVRAAETKPPEPVYHDAEQVTQFVDKAVAFLKSSIHEPEKAFAAFNDPKGKWIDGDLYIFVFDKKGVYKATGYRPERTGQNAWNMTDGAGLKVVQEMFKRTKRSGGPATVDYLWKNPNTGKMENKTSYVVPVEEWVVGAGFYHK